MAALLTSLTDSPHVFLQPSLPLYTDTLAYLKHALDPLAADVSHVQQLRQQDARKKRKRGEAAAVSEDDVLRLRQIHTDGFAPQQAHGRRDGSATVADLDAAEEWEEEGESSLGEEGRDYEVEGVDDDEDAVYDEDGDDDDEDDETLDAAHDAAEDGGQDDDVGDEDIDIDIDMDEGGLGNDEPAEEFVTDKFGLNDGFFSIDAFNKQSEFLEQQDARGDDDGAASDEEDVDWDADPLAGAGAVDGTAAPAVAEMEMDDEEDEEDGPTFGDPDAESEDDDDVVDGGEMDGVGDMGLGNTNSVMYADFFAPPAQKKKKNKKGRPNPHNFPESARSAKADQEEDGDIGRVADAVHRDLFDESEEEDDDDDEAEGEKHDPSDPRSRRSTHERRKAALQEEIRKLEAANVAKREWTLSGEARAADRPLNSLLEEDLEFERTGKPVPVITAEVSESIEELIKRRILNHDFQDIIRRRPDDLATGKDGRRGTLDFELDNNKSQKGLAEEYEEEHLRRTDPNFVDVKDEKLKKEEAEISALWNKIRSDLDSLSSWHFRPKAPAPQLEVRVDAPTIMMEDARPSAGDAVAGASQLAPQEVYKGGEANKGVNEEVAGKSGLPAAREELSREEKKRRRRREKERIHKANGNAPPPGANTSGAGGKGKHEVLSDLKKGGVKVIGKKGKLTDVEGKDARAGTGGGQNGAGRYKL
ncbi:hypothetical protein Tdes44962_MAKER10214 [Teratosphaeria destructans]|uniref:U3 small nucleolar ribonucleoprotein protein MPP10 n=1 Tax=Teratosphaeria destructans TaxID=418781 RepID=A0A9W7SMJ3_9PEZI|nr:hypothetical protein Tdes44962_MAKER10214 [Teratosphaeria destructans]